MVLSPWDQRGENFSSWRSVGVKPLLYAHKTVPFRLLPQFRLAVGPFGGVLDDAALTDILFGCSQQSGFYEAHISAGRTIVDGLQFDFFA